MCFLHMRNVQGYRGSHGPFHQLIDSNGIKVEGEGEWNARKHGGTERRVWRKIHIRIDRKHGKSVQPSSPPRHWQRAHAARGAAAIIPPRKNA